MNLYKKIKRACDNYIFPSDGNRCINCPSALFLEETYTTEDIQHLGGCGGVWLQYVRAHIKSRDSFEWFHKNNLNTCEGCRSFTLKLCREKYMVTRTVKI